MNLANVPSLQMWPELDAVSLCELSNTYTGGDIMFYESDIVILACLVTWVCYNI